jgi:hypothetical protein
VLSRFIAPRTSSAQIQAFLAIDSPHSFVIITLSFAPEKDVNPIHSITHPHGGNLLDPLSDRSIVSTRRFVIIERTSQQTQRTGFFNRNAIFID